MVTHYEIGPDQVACGRNNHNLVSITKPNGVTCKTCRSTEAHRAALAAAPAEMAEPKAAVGLQIIKSIRAAVRHDAGLRQSRLSWKEAWRLRLTMLGPGNRLPRGFEQQPFTKLFRPLQDELPQY
ncbi:MULTISPECIES: hypothetical protein [Pseudomonas]|uniref:Uncharacterized protein n=4 Tax=Pseudomonas TaxID=286 RepID=A0A3G1DH21_PSEAI|nr:MULTISPECIES: hypothetical protein [Pseudomonas]MCO6692690.1 hypothetical protein [Pseudomonas shirazica]AMP35779.1 Hypothetical protein [Pseudomonas aeruginosa]ESW38561.1 hypothetical protein O164_16980 [Pseudomonas taiwanensis SJ9]MCE0755571.1 hypothetical protein [Pseudomonas asiatica]MCE0853387.1 hypothetical protein [Pseudomonas asiatica]